MELIKLFVPTTFFDFLTCYGVSQLNVLKKLTHHFIFITIIIYLFIIAGQGKRIMSHKFNNIIF